MPWISARLRQPDGCPWDREQTHQSLRKHLLEEAYEVYDALEAGATPELAGELGDLWLQVVLHAQLAAEEGVFDLADVQEAIASKIVRRHPHVFGDAKGLTPAAVKGLWVQIKAQEKQERASRGGEEAEAELRTGALAGVPVNLPTLARALKLQGKASAVGFDWNDSRAVLAKLREELDEIGEALDAEDHGAVAGEVGDLLFAVVNLARHLDVDPDGALRTTNVKFERRFASIERTLAVRGKSPKDATLAEMDALWDAAKAAEKSGR
jgi:ATP diphosphatase